MAEKYLVHIDGERMDIELDCEGDQTRARFGGKDEWHAVDLQQVLDSGLYVLLMDNRPIELSVERRARTSSRVTVGRHRFETDVERWRPPSARSKRTVTTKSGLAEVAAPMTGSVVEALCAPGDMVAEGDVVMIIESMKMNNELRAPVSGTVMSVKAAAGDRVQGGDVLVELKPAPSDSGAEGD